MSQPQMTLVVTTINVPNLLEEYATNFAKYGHLDRTRAIIVGDRKTPHAEVASLAERLNQRGFSTLYMDLDVQDKYMDRFPEMKPLIPFNSDNRRNIGYLKAVEEGADILVAVDDDNFVGEDDWYAGHAIVGSTVRLNTATCENGWFNPCSLMDYEPSRTIYARGYPYNKRFDGKAITYREEEGRVVLNGGMWLREPDVDSLTRLTEPVLGMRVNTDRIMLAPGTLSPINTQNTAFHRDVLPAFYFVPVGELIGGLPVERYGDIWAGYFAKRVIDQVRDRVTFGLPACDHRRNVHRLLHDLELEFWAVQISDHLAEFVHSWTLTGQTYADCYLELADHLEAARWPHKRFGNEIAQFFGKMSHAMRMWIRTCERLGFKNQVTLNKNCAVTNSIPANVCT